MRISAIAAGRMELRRSPFGVVQTHREVDRLFLTIKRLPFRARLNVPATHGDNKGRTLPTDHPFVRHWHSLPRSMRVGENLKLYQEATSGGAQVGPAASSRAARRHRRADRAESQISLRNRMPSVYASLGAVRSREKLRELIVFLGRDLNQADRY